MRSMWPAGRRVTVRTMALRHGIDFTFMYLAVLGLGMFVAAFAWTRAWQPYIGLATAVLFMVWLAWLVSPRVGLGSTIFFALLGDNTTLRFFPFNKNLSSHESILWISDGISFSPLELTLMLGLASVGGRNWLRSKKLFVGGELSKPLWVLLATIFLGFVYGVARGGDLRIAMFEVRPLLYFPIVYLLAINVCETTKHYRHLMYAAFASIGLQSILSTEYALSLSATHRATLERLTEHGSSIGMNLLFVTFLASIALRGCSWKLRAALLFGSLSAAWVYLLSQRRVAFVALVIAVILFSIVLFWRQRRTFWMIVPLMAIVGAAYVGAMWNSNSPIGFPAQAVKTVLAPDDLSAKDQSSDLYRLVENYNLRQTIRSAPVTGVGFGQPFLRPIPLPDISVFEFNEYIPHNSILWIWIKTGIVGFMSFFYVLGRTLVIGADRVRRQAAGTDLVVSVAALLFVVMYAVFMFADIAWEPRNSTLFGFCLALCTAGVGLEKHTDDRETDAEPGELGESEEPRLVLVS